MLINHIFPVFWCRLCGTEDRRAQPPNMAEEMKHPLYGAQIEIPKLLPDVETGRRFDSEGFNI
jgi:hypothetical protein